MEVPGVLGYLRSTPLHRTAAAYHDGIVPLPSVTLTSVMSLESWLGAMWTWAGVLPHLAPAMPALRLGGSLVSVRSSRILSPSTKGVLPVVAIYKMGGLPRRQGGGP